MKYIIVVLTILSTINLFSEDFQIWERQFAVEGGLRQADFAGAEDEFIIAYDNHNIYRFNTLTSELLDSIYYEKTVISSVISNDGLKYYINVEDEILIIDPISMDVIDKIPTPELSGKIADNNLSQRTTQINISNDDNLITFIYAESNSNNERIYELIVFNLEQRKIITRVGDESRNYRSEFFNPTFTPDAETLLVATYIPPFNGNDKERQLWFYDITEGKFLDIGDKDMFKDKI